MFRLLCLTYFLSLCIGDTYLEMPKGSNNRLNEQSANRRNGNRMFDSQNNNRGGYNAADLHRTNGFNAYGTDKQMYDLSDRTSWDDGGANQRYQYETLLKEESIFRITWKAQHGCGNPKNNCNMVYQWTCDTCDQDDTACITKGNVDGMRVQIKNGLNTGTSNDANGLQNVKNTHTTNLNNNRGLHESEEYYTMAKQRARNTGLFIADQKVHGNKQINTRQNPGGTRRGQEVPEERDYYPWTHPTIWRSHLIFHNNLTECDEKMASETQNTKAKCHCIPGTAANTAAAWTQAQNAVVAKETEAECTAAGGNWDCQIFNIPKPKCVQAAWSQVNNLGNVENTGEGGLPQHYDMEVPSAAVLKTSGCHAYKWNENAGGNTNYAGPGANKEYFRIAWRMRYNMTVGDFAPYETDQICNQRSNAQQQSPIQQNPTVDVGVEMQGLRLAINTAQTGRTFQDRSHAYRITAKNTAQEAERVNAANGPGNRIWNLNVQGKRGNIVQTFPANEYDFWPRTLDLQAGDCIDFQWVGSNTHNNGNPAGDGQAGDAGEGRGGSDRHNIAQLASKDESYPIPLDVAMFADDFFTTAKCSFLDGTPVPSGNGASKAIGEKSAQIYLMSGGFYKGFGDIAAQETAGSNGAQTLNSLLNNVAASMRPMMCCTTAASVKPTPYYFTNTRNNNFSNRDQKLTIKVSNAKPALRQAQGRKVSSANLSPAVGR